jgi:hypothetical protein
VTAREGPVSDSRHAVAPRQSSAAVVPASRTLAWMSSSEADDVLYAVKLDVDEIALVEAQACAVAVAERRAPRGVVGVRRQVTNAGSILPPWLTTSTVVPSGAAASSRVHSSQWASATAANPGDCARSFGVSAVRLRPVPLVVVFDSARQVAGG